MSSTYRHELFTMRFLDSTGRPARIAGKFVPWGPKGPVIVTIEGKIRFVPIYSTLEKLKEAMIEGGIADYKVKVIDDGAEFLKSVYELGIPVCMDVRRVGDTLRFALVVPHPDDV